MVVRLLLEILVLIDDCVMLHGQVFGRLVELLLNEVSSFSHDLNPEVVDLVYTAALHNLQFALEFGFDLLSLCSA